MEQQKIKKWSRIFAIATVIGIFIWIYSTCNKVIEGGGDSHEVTVSEKKSIALAYAHVTVENKLKSPGSAKFAYVADSDIKAVDDSTFVILSYVDSQNDFGALKRTYFKCTMVVSGETATCTSIQLEEKD